VPGLHARSPWAIPAKGWKQVLVRSWGEAGDDNIGIVAAGVAFYGFLALVPLLGAVVLTYGLVAEPATVIKDIRSLTTFMPTDAAKLIGEQLMNVVKTSDGKKGLGVLLALLLALFGARNGAGSIITALNIAYEEKEQRGFLHVNLLALGITAAGVLVAILAVIAIAALGHLEDLVPHAPAPLLLLGKLLSYLLLVLAGAAGAAALYRFGPSRQKPRWVWLTPGSVLTAALWLLLTLGFGLYVAHFGNYNATYGSLSAVVVLLTWMYLSSYALMFGAELNSELEHQTAEDTTVGPAQVAGERGAWVADHVVEHAAVAQPGEDRPSIAQELVATRLVSLAGHPVGLKRVGLLAASMATAGLAFIGKKGRAPEGVAILAAAAALAWAGREE
jgi:membrane protein